MLASILRAYVRSNLRGSTRVTNFLAHKLKALQCCPVVVGDLPPTYMDLRQPTAQQWLRGEGFEAWECGERRVMRDLARTGAVIFDIGANLGLHTAYLSRLAGPQGKVYAFEANPRLHPTLRATCRDLGNCELVPFALAEEAGVLELFVPLDHTMASLKDWTALSAECVPCEARRLDDLTLPAPDFVKVDIEGAELSAFEGARTLLDKEEAPAILYEASRKNAEAFGHGVEAATEFLASLARPNFSFYVVGREGEVSHLEAFDFNHANLLALPAGRLGEASGLRSG